MILSSLNDATAVFKNCTARLSIIVVIPYSAENLNYRSDKQCPKSRRKSSSDNLGHENKEGPNSEIVVDAALVGTGVKLISEDSIKDENIKIEDLDEVLETTRKTYATFIPDGETKNNLKESMRLANSLDHIAIESTDIDTVRLGI